MRLLVVNYAMDPASLVLAWQMRVVHALAARCEQAGVLTEQIGDGYTAPANVTVETLDIRPGRFSRYRALNAQAVRMARHINAQAVFIHMAHRYAYLLSPAFKWLRLPVLMWYAHGSVSWHLRLALWAVDRVVTSTPEGFRLPSPKVHIIGQGIDTDLFPAIPRTADQDELITVSRISTRKRIHLLIEALTHLPADIKLRIVGAPLTDDDHRYMESLHEQVKRCHLENRVIFAGGVIQDELYMEYRHAFLHVNVSETNSMDKTVLESLSCGCAVLTSNPAFHTMLQNHPDMLLNDVDPAQIASRVLELRADRNRYTPEILRSLVIGHHDLPAYADRLLEHIDDLCHIR